MITLYLEMDFDSDNYKSLIEFLDTHKIKHALRVPNGSKPIVSGSLPPDFEIDIYPSYDKGKFAARYKGIITEPFDTPQDALTWAMSEAAMTV